MESRAILDTNVILRYLLDAPAEQAEAASRLIDSEQPLILSEVVLAEAAYVLASVYEAPRAEIVDTLIELIQRANIRLGHLPKPLCIQALEMCQNSKRNSFVDVLLWAQANASEAPVVYSFDRRFPGAGVTLVRPDA